MIVPLALVLGCSESAPTPRVLLIGLDGVRVDILTQANGMVTPVVGGRVVGR